MTASLLRLSARRVALSGNINTVRTFSAATVLRKGPVETAKDAVKSVDRTVSDAAVKGINKGEQLADKAKQAAGMKAAEAEGKARAAADQAADKAKDAADTVKSKV